MSANVVLPPPLWEKLTNSLAGFKGPLQGGKKREREKGIRGRKK